MKKISFFLVLALWSLHADATAQAGTMPATTPYGNVVQGYALAWSDEFDNNALDASKWDYRTDSKHWSAQLPSNVSVSDGTLKLALKKEKTGGKEYTGGGVISKKMFKYGYYEARFKVPPGAGWHTSFWTQKHDGQGGTEPDAAAQEIDICEQNSNNLLDYSAGVIAWGNKGAGLGRRDIKTPNLHDDFHVWGCEFTPTEVSFFFDGKLTHQVDATKLKQGLQNIWLTSIASFYGNTAAVADNALPATAEYDYVRFYERLAMP